MPPISARRSSARSRLPAATVCGQRSAKPAPVGVQAEKVLQAGVNAAPSTSGGAPGRRHAPAPGAAGSADAAIAAASRATIAADLGVEVARPRGRASCSRGPTRSRSGRRSSRARRRRSASRRPGRDEVLHLVGRHGGEAEARAPRPRGVRERGVARIERGPRRVGRRRRRRGARAGARARGRRSGSRASSGRRRLRRRSCGRRRSSPAGSR